MSPDKKPTEDLAARERRLENRTVWMQAHEVAAAQRDLAITDREELVRLREGYIEARHEAERARLERERLLVQIRDANQKLVLASLQAHELADDAILARKLADENAERFTSLIKTSSALVFRATSTGQLDLAAEAWRSLTGMDLGPDEWGWLEAVHPLDRDRVRESWIEAVAAARPYTCQHRIKNRKGGYASVEARAVPILKSGSVREWIGMLTDVSDRVRVEEARDQFIAILGHDLRSPLSSILAGIDIFADLHEPYKRTASRIERSAFRIEAIIRDLLDFARGRLGGGIPVMPRSCDMRLICDDVVQEIKQISPTRAIHFEGTGDLQATWDPDRIEQAMSNLVGNAVTHGEDPIIVTSHGEITHIVTEVRNRGRSIPDAMLSTLFEPFTSADDTTRRERRGGLGLGLYIASEIIRAHGGTLAASSIPGEETIFTFRLPRMVATPARTASGERVSLGRLAWTP